MNTCKDCKFSEEHPMFGPLTPPICTNKKNPVAGFIENDWEACEMFEPRT